MSSHDDHEDMTSQTEKNISKIPNILPRERVFPIQVGGEVFKLSGASLSSDAPSYFSQYFRCQVARAEETGEDLNTAIRTLNIDRDPVTFRDIALHLQGYHICPRDGTHFVRLFADAQFYSLPRLMSQLYEESIFISIGHREFQIPREILTSAGNSPNFFSLGFGLLFSSKDEVFPGLDRENLIRPPSILPPTVLNRSADTFAELLRLLQGYPVEIRNETHREDLLRDARYFHFKGLEQRLIPHKISFNPLRGQDEITLRLENVQKSGISIKHTEEVADMDLDALDMCKFTGMVHYARPYVDDHAAELVLEIAGQNSKLHLTPDGPRLELFRDTRTRFTKLLEVMATKIGMPPTTQPLGLLMASGGADSHVATPSTTPLSESDFVKVEISDETAITLDGQDYNASQIEAATEKENGETGTGSRKRRRTSGGDHTSGSTSWIVDDGQWRVSIQPSTGEKLVECVLQAVQVDAISTEASRNKRRGFLR